MAKGKLAQIKTKETDASVEEFIQTLPDAQKQADCRTLITMMQEATGCPPRLWGSNMIGFGNVRVESERTGRQVDWFRMGFAPRKSNFTLYLMSSLKELAPILQRLGKHKVGGGCLYINRLSDVGVAVLKELIQTAARN